MKKLIAIILLLLLLLPFQAFAYYTTIDFYEIEPLMESRSQLIENAEKSYENAEDDIEDGLSAIEDALDAFQLISDTYGGGDGSNPQYEAAISYLLEVQRQTLLQQKRSLENQDLEKAELQTDITKYNVIWNMEMLYITYNSLERQLDNLLNNKELLSKQLKVLETQKELGLITDYAYEKTESELFSLESAINQLQLSINSIKNQFNISLKQDYDSELEIMEVPRVTEEKLASIQVDRDFENAVEDSIMVLLNEDDFDNQDEEIRKFKNGFYNIYKTVLDKDLALKAEQAKMEVAEKSYNISKLKYELGLISFLQLESEKNSYLSQKSNLETAQDVLFQAYRQYEWAQRGLIVSAGSSS